MTKLGRRLRVVGRAEAVKAKKDPLPKSNELQEVFLEAILEEELLLPRQLRL